MDWERQLALATVAALLAGLLALALKMGHFTDFYSIDGDLKYLAAQAIAHNPLNPAIRYPYQAHDHSGRYTLPLTAWYGHDYAGYSLPFEYLAGATMALFGAGGIVLPAIAGTAVLLLVQLELSRLCGLRGNLPLVLIATTLATPLLFYSVSFWEHTWGVALYLAGLLLLVRSVLVSGRQSIALSLTAGILFGGATLMRRETAIPAVITLAIVPLLFRRRRNVVNSALAGAVLLVPIAAILLFHPEPLALGLTHASPGRSPIGVTKGLTRLDKLQFLMAGSYATALFFVATACLLLTRRFKPRLSAPLVVAGSIVTGLALIVQLLTHFTYADENPLAFCPLAIWGVWSVAFWRNSGEEDRLDLALWIIALLGMVAVAVAAYDDGGAQWGPRYLLFAFPILVLLAFKTRRTMLQTATADGSKRMINYGFVAMLALSVFLQGLSLIALNTKQELGSQVVATISATRSRIIVSPHPIIAELAPSYDSHLDLYAPTPALMGTLMAQLRMQGVRRLVMLCDSVNPCEWNGYPGWLHGRVITIPRNFRYAIYQAPSAR